MIDLERSAHVVGRCGTRTEPHATAVQLDFMTFSGPSNKAPCGNFPTRSRRTSTRTFSARSWFSRSGGSGGPRGGEQRRWLYHGMSLAELFPSAADWKRPCSRQRSSASRASAQFYEAFLVEYGAATPDWSRARRRIAICRAQVVKSRRRRRRRIRGERCKQVPGQGDQHHSDTKTGFHRSPLYRAFFVALVRLCQAMSAIALTPAPPRG